MNRIYLSGAMTGLPDLNFPAFNEAALRLRSTENAKQAIDFNDHGREKRS